MIEHFNPPTLPRPSGFSHATGAGDLVLFGGQIASDGEGHVIGPGDVAAQFRQAVGNLGLALEGARCKPTDVVKITYYVTDVAAYRSRLKEVGEAYRAVFGRHFPASTLLEVKGLFEPEAMVEIECLAIRGQGG